MKAGALGVEIVLAGKLPSDRAKSWRFAQGYLKKTGDPAKVVARAQAQAKTMAGVIGIKVSILPPTAVIHDRIDVNEELLAKIRALANVPVVIAEEPKKQARKKKKSKESAE